MGVRDALVPFQLPDGQGREFFRNAGETRHRGLEAALAAVVTPAIMVETAYTLSDFVFVDDGIATASFEDNRLPGVPNHHAFLRLRVAPNRTVSVEVEDEYTDRFFVNDANTASNGSTHQVDARVLFDVTVRNLGLRPFLAVNNLLDERYNSSVVINAAGGRFYEPAPGRNLYLGAAVRFGGW
jgi:iron complex outermembrane receptor protein